jgi:hypothetical protein
MSSNTTDTAESGVQESEYPIMRKSIKDEFVEEINGDVDDARRADLMEYIEVLMNVQADLEIELAGGR